MRPVFDVQRIHYRWYGEHQSYLLITVGSTGAVAELWRRFITKKGNIMNDKISDRMEEIAKAPDQTKEETLEQIMEKVVVRQEANVDMKQDKEVK